MSEEVWGLSRRCQWGGPWIALQWRLTNVPGLFPAFLETLLVSSQLLQPGDLPHWGTGWVDGRPVLECAGLERGAAEAGPLAPRPGPYSGGDKPIAVLPDFVSLPVFGTLGFPPSYRQLRSWHKGVKSTCTLQPMAMRSAFAASPDWRTHSGREARGRPLCPRMRLKGWGSGGCLRHTDRLRHEQHGWPGSSGGARRAVFSQVSQGEGPEGSRGMAGRRPGEPGAVDGRQRQGRDRGWGECQAHPRISNFLGGIKPAAANTSNAALLGKRYLQQARPS